MFLGIDVGGTHTDAVIIHEGRVMASCKVATQHDDLLASVREATDSLLGQVPAESVVRVNLSTTLSTNAIVEGRTEDVGVVVSAGPGIDPEHVRVGRFYHAVDGSIDHRGVEIAGLDEEALGAVADEYAGAGVRVFAVVSKFSTRNPAHERAMAKAVMQAGRGVGENGSDGNGSGEKDDGAGGDFVAMGHSTSAQLNFPRRVATAYYNAAVWRLYNRFADAVEATMKERGITAPVYMLKADGGTMPLSASRLRPVESILSGPAASVMGIMALCDIQSTCNEDSLVLDIGGTTTDMAVFASGEPVIERGGIDVGSYSTTVRALRTRSIGIGGDSHVHVQAGVVRVGPERFGPSMCQDGEIPTLIDALNVCGHAKLGDMEASLRGFETLGNAHGMEPKALAESAIDKAMQSIVAEAQRLIDDINDRPVYTILELLEGRKIKPSRIYVMGGPAMVVRNLIMDAMNCRVVVPTDFAVANAIGAALTQTTAELELFADTEHGKCFIPTLEKEYPVAKRYTLETAQEEACEALRQHLYDMGVEDTLLHVDIVEASSFNIVDDDGFAGRSIRVKCQVRPSISHFQ